MSTLLNDKVTLLTMIFTKKKILLFYGLVIGSSAQV